MRIALLSLSTAVFLAACGQTIQARCSEAHGGDGAGYVSCVKKAEHAVRTRVPRPPNPNG